MVNQIQDWDGADTSLLKIENHPNLYAGSMIAYQPMLSYFPPHDVAWYNCIHKDHGRSRYPYHIGTFNKDLSNACYDCIGREYQLNNRGFWRQTKPPEGSPAYVQWAEWVWKNSKEERLFKKWLSKQFGGIDDVEPNVAQEVYPEQLTLF